MGTLLADPQRRLRLLLALMALLAFVSVAVNGHRWQKNKGVKSTALTPPSTITPPSPNPDVGQLHQIWSWVASHPEDVTARLELARLFFLNGRFPEAEAQLAILRRRQPKRADIYYWLSLVQKQEGRLEAALASIEHACRLDPDNRRFREWLGEIYLAHGRSEEAANTFDACLERWPDSYAALLGKAHAMEQLYEAKRPVPIPDMVTPVEKAVRLDPRNPEGVTMLARMAFAYLQQFDRAIQLARQAIELDPAQAGPYMILVEISLNDPTPANRSQAVAWARTAARLDPRRPEPLYLLGRALLREGDLPSAIDAFERSTRIQLMPQAVYQLSLTYARAGNTEKARYYSRLYQTWNQFAERRKVLLALLQHRPRDVALHAQLAELYLRQGAVAPAENWARKGLLLRPEDARLRRLLQRTTSREKEGTTDERR